MSRKQNFHCLLVLLSILCAVSNQLPPYLHKMPLNLTANYVYYATLYFGSDQQNISVLVDTGSRTLAAFCSLCTRGCLLDQEFKVETSNTFQNVTCETIQDIVKESVAATSLRICNNMCTRIPSTQQYQCKGELNYGSSSLASYLDYLLIRDQVATQLNGLTVRSSFGCIYDESNFDTGIWGVSLSPENEILDQIYQADLDSNYTDAQKVFTICTEGTTAIMNIGAVDTSTHIGEGYKLRVNPGLSLWWSIRTNDIGRISYEKSNLTIREQNQTFGQYGIILDSGTDFIILPSLILSKISTIANQRCSAVKNCRKTQAYEIFSETFIIIDPTTFFTGEFIDLQIGGRALSTPLSNYFWNLGDSVWALAVVSAEEFNFQMSILGSIWMNNFDIAFDRSTFSITIYDIASCTGPATRRLQTDDDDDSSEYELPGVRGDRLDGVEAITNLKMKHQRGIKKMQSEKQN